MKSISTIFILYLTMRILIVSFLYLLAITFQSCKSPTAPVTNNSADTTSHNWSFVTYTINGEAGGIFQDVVIINDTLAYTGGQLNIQDSTGKYSYYAAAVWDGHKWEPKKLHDSNNNLIPYLTGLIAFDKSNIWLTNGEVYRWDGISSKVSTTFDRISLIGGEENGQSVDKIWGTSSDNIYGVGSEGMMTFYNGQTWQKFGNKTDLIFDDIYGAINPNTGKQEILALAHPNYSLDISIFSLQGSTATKISTYPLNPIEVGFASIWFVPDRHYYLGGTGIYEKNSLSDSTWKKGYSGIPLPSVYKIRGNAINDLFIAGWEGEFSHWNGASWKSYKSEIGLPPESAYTSVALKENLVIAVGTNNSRAIITIGRR